MSDQLPDVIGAAGHGIEAQPVQLAGYPSAANSSSVPLIADDEFIGEWETNYLDQIEINCAADQAGTLWIEFSPDGGDTITLSLPFVVKASTFTDDVPSNPFFRTLIKGAGRAFRLRFVNGGTGQSRFLLFATSGNQLYPYSASKTGALLTTQRQEDKGIFSAISATLTTASTAWRMLVDLSDTDTYGHDPLDYIAISKLVLTIDKSTNARGSFSVGVITRIDGTDADVLFFAGVPFNNSDAQRIAFDRTYAPDLIKAYVDGDGNTPFLVTSAVVTGITAINTGGTLVGSQGNVTPAVGDIVARWVLDAGTTFLGAAQAYYHSRDA